MRLCNNAHLYLNMTITGCVKFKGPEQIVTFKVRQSESPGTIKLFLYK